MSTKVKCFGSSTHRLTGTTGGKSSSTTRVKCPAIVQTLGGEQRSPLSSTSWKARGVMLANISAKSQRKSRNVY